jgi:hypothetical protein
MILKNAFPAMLYTTLLVWSSMSLADEYSPGEFLSLDLSKALLSPKPLGPPAEFAPVTVEARTDPGSEVAQAPMEPKAQPKITVPRTRIAHIRAPKPRGAVRARLARRRGNPLDAQALDTRIQVWPCRSGGICDWRRARN